MTGDTIFEYSFAVVLVALPALAIFFIGYAVADMKSYKDQTPYIRLQEDEWTCVESHRVWNEPRRGILTRFGRIGKRPGHYSTVCDKWTRELSRKKP